MAPRLAADLVVLIHVLFVLFVAFGWILVVRRPKIAWLHLPAVIWGAAIEFAGWICPLTPLENSLRRAAGDDGYGGGFIERYVVGVLYPEALGRPLQIILGVGVLIINGAAYWWLVARRLSASRAGDSARSRSRS